MAIRRLPAAPNLENLKNQAKSLLSALRDGEEQALADFAEFHPRQLAPDAAHLTDAQPALTRSYGHTSWQALTLAVQAQRNAPQAGDPQGFPLDRAVNRRNVRNFLRVYAPEIAFVELELILALHASFGGVAAESDVVATVRGHRIHCPLLFTVAQAPVPCRHPVADSAR